MNRLHALAASLALAVFLAASVPAADEKPVKKGKAHVVKMIDDAFDPKEITIAVGDSLAWENKGKHEHDAVSENKVTPFNTKTVKPGTKSKAVTFAKAGTFKYECTFHEGMTGTVIVKGKGK